MRAQELFGSICEYLVLARRTGEAKTENEEENKAEQSNGEEEQEEVIEEEVEPPEEEEVVDAFNYFLSMLVLVGVNEEDFFKAYLEKDKIIRDRLLSGY